MRISRTVLATAVMISVLLSAGCSSKPAQPAPAPAPEMGVIDTQKAIRSHPKYAQYQSLQKEFNTLREQLAAQQSLTAPAPASGTPAVDPSGINDALNQEFNAKMHEKQDELNRALNEKAAQAKAALDKEYQAAAQKLDAEYQPQIFNLQLKLKTVQLTKEEAAAVQAEMERLEKERADKSAAIQKDFSDRLDAAMAPVKEDSQRQLTAYADQLNRELAAKRDAQTAALAPPGNSPPPVPDAGLTDKQQALDAKQQEINALQSFIVRDVQDKVAKVAVQRNLSTVLTNVQVNVNAVDITSAVIAEFNK